MKVLGKCLLMSFFGTLGVLEPSLSSRELVNDAADVDDGSLPSSNSEKT
jgi:hypothetical protein